jgi:hypothetical protein
MTTLINTNKKVVFLNNGVLVNSSPPLDICTHTNAALRPVLNELCGPPVG